jgi:DNA helicase-2/ATP-dependent DNA helicase PcrA
MTLHDTRLAWPADVDLALRWYGPLLTQRFDDAAVRQADLEQLARIANTYGSREQFLTELTLDPPDATSAQSGAPLLDEDYLILSTIHSEGTGVAFGLRAQRGRRLHSVRHEHGRRRGHRGRAAVAVRGDDPREGVAATGRAAAFYVHQQTGLGDRHVYGTRSRFVPDAAAVRNLSEAREDDAPRTPVGDVTVHIDVARKLRNAWS